METEVAGLSIDMIEPRQLFGRSLSSVVESNLKAKLNLFGSYEAWRVQRGSAGAGRPDLVMISDTAMEDASLDDVVADVKSRDADTKVVVVGLSERQEDIADALVSGVSGYIPTSCGLQVLVEGLRLILAGGVYAPVMPLLHRIEMEDQASASRNGDAPRACSTPLTPRQREVLKLLREGKSNKIIAYQLNMREGTVKVHIRNLMKKFQATNRTQVALIGSHHEARAGLEV